MKKRIVILCLCAALLLGGTVPCLAQQPTVSASAAILMDADTGRVLYEKNARDRMGIASTTKIMTALVALEQAELQQEVVVTQEHMVEGSSMYLKPGETITVEHLLYGLLLSSGNDAALALAEGCCGSVEAFVAEMNRKARELGLEDTSFANPNGLDDDAHYSTAWDMAHLAAYAVENPAFVRFCSTRTVTVGGRTLSNHNRLLSSIDGCIGLKTGYTMSAGRTLVSCVRRDGHTLVAVTLKDGNDWEDHQTLYEYGFAALSQEETEGAA